MPTDPYKGVLFTEGEGADIQDLNNMRGFSEARLFDQVIRGVAGAGILGASGADPDRSTFVDEAPFLYCLSGTAGYIVPRLVSAREITVVGGTILQQVGTVSGNEATLLPYTIADAEFVFTLAIGDATHPRIDVIEVKLEYVDGNSESRIVQDPPPSTAQSVQSVDKKRRIQATFQVRQGTPAATPAYPSLTAGFAALGAVYVPAAHDAIFTAAIHIEDLRHPIGIKQRDVLPGDFIVESPATIEMDATNGVSYARVPPSNSASIWVPCPAPPTGRIMGIGVYWRCDSTAHGVTLQGQQLVNPLNQSAFPPVLVNIPIGDIETALGSGGSADWAWSFIGYADLAEAIAVAGSTPRNAEGLGAGVWGNGLRCGPSLRPLTNGPAPLASVYRLLLKFDFTTGGGSDAAIAFVRWYYADGLA